MAKIGCREWARRLLFVFGVILFCISHSLTPAGVAGRDWTQATSNVVWGQRWNHKTVVHNGKIWVLGGNGDSLGSVWYSSDGLAWTQAVAVSRATFDDEYAAVVHNGKIWTLGAAIGREVYCSTDGRTWTRVLPDPPWVPRSYPAAVVHNGKIWVLGGINTLRDPAIYYNDVWSSVDGIHWTSVTLRAQWARRAGAQAISFGGKIWVIGGAGEVVQLNDVWYSLDGASWTRLTTGNPPWAVRSGAGVAIDGRRIWAMGGITFFPGWTLNDVWYSGDGVNWDLATPAAPWRDRCGIPAVVYKNRLWVLGGVNRSHNGNMWIDTPLNDVWYSPIPTDAGPSWKLYP